MSDYESDMRAFVTGATGFIGGQVARRLRARGDEVIATVRDRGRATELDALGCRLVSVPLDDQESLVEAVQGCDAVFHLAGRFDIGIRAAERADMYRSNVVATTCVLDAAQRAGVAKIVYASTVNVFGDTHGEVVDETYTRSDEKFLSYYDETKYRAHLVAVDRAQAGAPVVIVQPCVVYGPGDHFEIGRQILMAGRGKLPALMMGDAGVTMSFVGDVADGMVAACDRGRRGESYVLGGEVTRLRDVLKQAAHLGGKRFKPVELPTGLLKAAAPLGPVLGPLTGYPSNFAEVISASNNVTYWATDRKARNDLAYRSLTLEEGLRSTLASAGIRTR